MRGDIENHRLRREIIATFVTNNMVNRVGPTFVSQLMEETGRSASDVARAYAIARNSFDSRSLFGEIEALDNKIPAGLQMRLMIDVARLAERATRWFLKGSSHGLDITQHEAEFRPRIATLENELETILPDREREHFHSRISELERLGVPVTLARRLAGLDFYSSFTDIVRIQRGTKRSIEEVGGVYFGVGNRFDFDRLRAIARAIPADTPWQKTAVAGAVDDLFLYQSILTAGALAEGGGAREALAAWLSRRARQVTRTEQVLGEIRSASTVDLPILAVATRQLRSLIES